MSDRTNGPRYIPLPEVKEYTDDFRVVELGLPIGFDESQLGVNLSLISGVSRLAGFGRVTLAGYDGEHENLDVMWTTNNNGTAAAVGAKTGRKPQQHKIDGANSPDTNSMSFLPEIVVADRKDVRLSINSSAVDDRIRASKHTSPKGLLDPSARAKELNRASKAAMSEAVRQRLLARPRLHTTLGALTIWSGLDFLDGGYNVASSLGHDLQNSILAVFLMGMIEKTRGREPLVSTVLGAPLDRYAVARLAIASRTLIKAIPSSN